jgi:hypothetical protein
MNSWKLSNISQTLCIYVYVSVLMGVCGLWIQIVMSIMECDSSYSFVLISIILDNCNI